MSEHIPDHFIEQMADRFRMLSDPTRLSILKVLLDGERSVGDIVAESGHSQANVSKHLALLTRAGLLGRRKEGLKVFYSVVDPLVSALCEVACRHIGGRTAPRSRRRR